MSKSKVYGLGAREANFNRKRKKHLKGKLAPAKQDRPDPRKPHAIECKYVGDSDFFRELSGAWHVLDRFTTKKARDAKFQYLIRCHKFPYKYRTTTIPVEA